MKIVIDTKEDIHILRHVIQLLHAVSTASSTKQKYGLEDSTSFGGPSYPLSPQPVSQTTPPVTDATPLFSMFDAPSTPSTDNSFNSLFPSMTEQKKDSDKGDFLDSLEVY